MIPLVLALHTVASLVWVGGMFFALAILRPSMPPLPPETAMALWRRVFERFFVWVWASILTLLGTGYGVVLFGYEGFSAIGMHIRIMQVTGLIMVGLFVWMWSIPWQTFRQAVDDGDHPTAAAAMKRIRLVVAINLPLGLFTAAIGATGSFWTY